MAVTVKSKTAGLVVPPSVRRQAGIRAGDRLEFKVSSRKITIVAKPPVEVEEYTPAQRRVIDREIAKGLEDIRKGRVHGPFASADEMMRYLREFTTKHKAAK